MPRVSLAVLSLALPALLAAQTPAATPAVPPPAQPPYATDSAAIRQVLGRLFEGMRTRDTAAMRALFHEPTAMRSAYIRQGKNTVDADGVEDWLQGVASAPADREFDERLGPPEIRVDGNLGNVWVYYEFYVSGTFSHCGVDNFQLARTDAGWKIILLADSRRRQGCAMSLATP